MSDVFISFFCVLFVTNSTTFDPSSAPPIELKTFHLSPAGGGPEKYPNLTFQFNFFLDFLNQPGIYSSVRGFRAPGGSTKIYSICNLLK